MNRDSIWLWLVPIFCVFFGLLLGYKDGKQVADRWYASHKTTTEARPVPMSKLPVVIGHDNSVESPEGSGKNFAIGKNLEVRGSDVLGIVCIPETSGSLIEANYSDLHLTVYCDGQEWQNKSPRPGYGP